MTESIQDRDERGELRTRSLQSAQDEHNKAADALERDDWGNYAFHTLNAATFKARADLHTGRNE